METLLKLIDSIFVYDGTMVLPTVIIIAVGIFVYYRYIKPLIIKIIKANDAIHQTADSMEALKNNAGTVDNAARIEVGLELLQDFSGDLKELQIRLKDISYTLNKMSENSTDSDKNYERKLNELILEFTKLNARIEINLNSVRGVK